ncbi:hypothetical protein ABMA28_011772 [Loxostege sticticalis]|uniref:THAP-type domain-containing protein n=1 Tax=Loxostege sticticalis TaxID=481309 RepID=A0ABD0TKR2_LOXSC
MSQSKAKCCVPGCSISGRSHRVLHGYPNYVKEPERFRSWMYAVGGDILGLSDEHIYKNRRVCHSHFEAKYCLRNNRISAIAIPTLNLLGISSIPRFHFGEDRPVRKLQISSTYASTSKDNYNIFDDIPATKQSDDTETINTDQPLAADIAEKENNPLIIVGEIAPPLTCEEDKQKLKTVHSSKSYQKSIRDVMELQPSTSQKCIVSTRPQANKRTLSLENVEVDQPKKKIKKIAANQEKKNNSSIVAGIKSLRRYQLTPKEKELFTELRKIKNRLQKCKDDLKLQKEQWKAAKKICSTPKFIEGMENWSKPLKILTILQFREHKKKEKGRRFTTEEKIIALSILKQSPKAYIKKL